MGKEFMDHYTETKSVAVKPGDAAPECQRKPAAHPVPAPILNTPDSIMLAFAVVEETIAASESCRWTAASSGFMSGGLAGEAKASKSTDGRLSTNG